MLMCLSSQDRDTKDLLKSLLDQIRVSTTLKQFNLLTDLKEEGHCCYKSRSDSRIRSKQSELKRFFSFHIQAQLNTELEEEEKLAKQKQEDANIAEWDNVQAMIDADYELAARLQA
ncbi:hypothetical protein Tco_0732464 [Tanacetum coccineum]